MIAPRDVPDVLVLPLLSPLQTLPCSQLMIVLESVAAPLLLLLLLLLAAGRHAATLPDREAKKGHGREAEVTFAGERWLQSSRGRVRG